MNCFLKLYPYLAIAPLHLSLSLPQRNSCPGYQVPLPSIIIKSNLFCMLSGNKLQNRGHNTLVPLNQIKVFCCFHCLCLANVAKCNAKPPREGSLFHLKLILLIGFSHRWISLFLSHAQWRRCVWPRRLARTPLVQARSRWWPSMGSAFTSWALSLRAGYW